MSPRHRHRTHITVSLSTLARVLARQGRTDEAALAESRRLAGGPGRDAAPYGGRGRSYPPESAHRAQPRFARTFPRVGSI